RPPLRSPTLRHLVEVDQAREAERDRHEVDERAVHDAQHVGGVAVRPDPVGLEPHEPGEQEHDGRAHQLHRALQPPLSAGAEEPIDEIHERVLVRPRHERQPGEDQHHQHELGDLERAPHRPVEDVPRHHVHEREEHHGQEDGGGGDAENRVGAPLPPALGSAHRPAATFFSSSRNSARILAASTPLALAFWIQSSMIGADRFFTSATRAASALTILTPDFLSASKPFWSASSQDRPACRAIHSPQILRPWISLMLLTGRLVNSWPGPWVNTPSSFTPLYSPTLWKCLQ